MFHQSSDITRHPFLGRAACRSLASQVHELRGAWTERNGFFTLGAASYMDVVSSPARYAERRVKGNPLLREVFGDVHSQLATLIAEMVREPADLDDAYALPGVHVFPDADFGGEAGAHFDLQWQALWPEAPRSGTLSFTLPLELPPGGASLDVWHVRVDSYRGGASPVAYAERHRGQRLPYALGELLIHDGLTLHAIGRVPPESGGVRMTLQGHAWRTPTGRWIVYW